MNENQKFKDFNLIVESLESGLNSVGKFQVFRNDSNIIFVLGRVRFDVQVWLFTQRFVEALTKFSDDCPNGLVQSSSLPKNEVKVMWIAPASGSGCVRFRYVCKQ
jgi:hypothetical protein